VHSLRGARNRRSHPIDGRTIVGIASGKGGTGKTTIATNLAKLLSDRGHPVRLLDCDVEEPNCHIFLDPEITSSTQVDVPVPEVDDEACTQCGRCAEVCQFNALAVLKTTVLTFPELCHGCSGCWRVCPTGAITPTGREVGCVEKGTACGFPFIYGRLRIGEAMSPPLIRAVKAELGDEGAVLIDAPPGTSCPVIEAVKDVDFLILVTEPTPFGLNDLALAVEMARELERPHGVVINRVGVGDDRVQAYCEAEDLVVLQEIPDDRRVAEAYSRGEMAIDAVPGYREHFAALWREVADRTGGQQ